MNLTAPVYSGATVNSVMTKLNTYLYIGITVFAIALCIHSSAVTWDLETFEQRLHTSVVLFVLTAVTTFVFQYVRAIAASRKLVIWCAVFSIIAVDIVYSHVRGQIIILVIPALFCLPGSLFGLFAADLAKMKRPQATRINVLEEPAESVT